MWFKDRCRRPTGVSVVYGWIPNASVRLCVCVCVCVYVCVCECVWLEFSYCNILQWKNLNINRSREINVMNTCTNLQLQQLTAHVQLCSICISLETHDLIPHPRAFKLTSEEKRTSGLAWRQTSGQLCWRSNGPASPGLQAKLLNS